MKNLAAVPASIQNSVVVLRCRGVELDARERQDVHRGEVTLGLVFQRIHRIEWKIIGRAREVEVQCSLRALSGKFAATAVEATVRGALRSVTEKILKQKRREKTIRVTRRRTSVVKRPRA